MAALALPLVAGGAGYTEVDAAHVRIAPEKYRNKRVEYTAEFLRAHSTFLPYMEKSGLRIDRHMLVVVGDPMLPVVIRKKGNITEQVAVLERGTMLRVQGKVKQFRSAPKNTTYPRYYVEAETIQPLEALPEEYRADEKKSQRGVDAPGRRGGRGAGGI